MVSKSTCISLYHLVLFYKCTLWAYISNFVFCIFLSKIRKLNMTPIFGKEKIFGKLERVVSLDTLRIENFDEISPSHTVVFYSLRKLLMLN